MFQTVLLLVFFCLLKENLSLKQQQQQQQQQMLLKIGNITNYITFPPAKKSSFGWDWIPIQKDCAFFSLSVPFVGFKALFSLSGL